MLKLSATISEDMIQSLLLGSLYLNMHRIVAYEI